MTDKPRPSLFALTRTLGLQLQVWWMRRRGIAKDLIVAVGIATLALIARGIWP